MNERLNEQRRIVAYLDMRPSAAGSAAGAPQEGDVTVRYGGGIAPKADVDIVPLWNTVRALI